MGNLLCLNRSEHNIRTLTPRDELADIPENQNLPIKKNKNNRYAKIKVVLYISKDISKDIIKNIFL